MQNQSAAAAPAPVLDALRRQNAAMVAGDVETLQNLLAEEFVAVHINGHHQPKHEWLKEISDGRMTYQRIEEQSTVVLLNDAGAQATSRNLVTATIHGSHGTWRLESKSTLVRRDDRWMITRSAATAY